MRSSYPPKFTEKRIVLYPNNRSRTERYGNACGVHVTRSEEEDGKPKKVPCESLRITYEAHGAFGWPSVVEPRQRPTGAT